MKIGTCMTDVSPKTPVHLAGFGNPNRRFLGTHDPLYVTAVAVCCNGGSFVFVGADVLGFDRNRLPQIRRRAAERTGIDPHAILFNASHTHSAPQVLPDAEPYIGAYVAEYADFFYEAVYQTIVGAMDDLEDGVLYMGTGICAGIGINRRRITDGIYAFAPNEDGLRNDEATLLWAECAGRTKALVYNFNCHPSVTGFDYASGDYPGVARTVLRERHPGVTPLFLQGCCGDIRARTVDGDRFRPGTYEDVQHFGTLLADCVDGIMDRSGRVIDGPLKTSVTEAQLPLQEKKPRDYYVKRAQDDKESPLVRACMQYFSDAYDTLPTSIPYTVQRADFGDTLTMIGLEGEVCVGYDYHAKSIFSDRHVMTSAYSNGNPGYICMTDMYETGGYEPVDSAPVYRVPEGFDPSTEQVIVDAMKSLR